MPTRTIQSNDRVAEVQYICDVCGKLIQTRLIPKEEADKQQTQQFTCCQCKKAAKP